MPKTKMAGLMFDNQSTRYVRVDSDGRLLEGRPRFVSAIKALAAAENYAAEDVLSESASAGTAWEFKNVTEKPGGAGAIVSARVLIETTALTPRVALFLFKDTPSTNKNDNAANTAPAYADRLLYIGRVDFAPCSDLGGQSEAEATTSPPGDLPVYFECMGDSTSIYGIPVLKDAVTEEAAGMHMEFKLEVVDFS